MTESAERSIFGTPGSLEAAIGNYTVAVRSNGRFSSTRELIEAHRAGDSEATLIWVKSVRVLARAITSFINILDPEIVILGGGITRAGAYLFDPLAEFLDEFEWRPAGHRVRIVPARLGEWAGAYGAAWNAAASKSLRETQRTKARKVIDIVSQNADYRRPMSRMNLLDTKATPTYSVCRRWPGREPLASRPFNSDSPQLPMTLQDP